jgi:hypothetical protein
MRLPRVAPPRIGRWLARPRHGALAVGVSLVLLTAAWVMATLPFAAPDEPEHYLRALGIANGKLLGPRVPYPDPQLTPAALAWADQGTRAILVPARLAPPEVNCLDGKPDIGNGSCLEATEVGNYLPLPYLLPALALKVSPDAATGLWLSRFASALPCVALILLAIALLWAGSGWSILGLLICVSPMALFVTSVLNPNGLEIAACLAFAAAILRIGRAPARSPTWVWFALAFSGAVAILSWQLGPVFVTADVLLGVALLGRAGRRALREVGRRRAVSTALVLCAAAAAYVIYGIASGVAHAHFGIQPIRASLHGGRAQLGPVLRDSVGTFGSLTVHLPAGAYWVWWLLVLGILAAALKLGSSRERRLLTAVVVLALAFPVLFYAWVYRFSGNGLQGRYVLPELMLIPLMAGEVLQRHLDRYALRRWSALVFGAAVTVVAVFQLFAWWINASSAAGAPHTIGFFAHASWQPPLGWLPWVVMAVVAAGALFAFAVSQASALAREGQLARVHSLHRPVEMDAEARRP